MSKFPVFAGKLRIALTSADPAARIQEINGLGIPVTNLQKCGDLTVYFTILHRHLKKIEVLADRRGDSITILSKEGLYWSIINLRDRPILLMGIVLLLLVTLILPNLVLFISVEGNLQIPEERILEIAKDAGITFGAHRRQIRSEKVKNQLLDELPQLQWSGVNTSGCTATITVKERSISDPSKGKYAVSNIVASCDGVISSCTATSGTAVCTVGQAVQKGQLLVAGYADYGNYIAAGRAEGEVFATTRHQMKAVTPLKQVEKGKVRNQITNYSICFGKKRINLYKGSGIYDGSCGKMETRYQLTLPGGFKLPVILIVQCFTECNLDNSVQEQQDLSARLSACLRSRLLETTVACSVLDAQERLITGDEIAVLDAVYDCVEMIGREQVVQIGDFHEQTD